jgi:undecaprenyl-diphosphatase
LKGADNIPVSALARAIEGIKIADRMSLRFVAELRRPVLNSLMRGLSRAGDWQTWTVLAFAALTFGESSRALALVVLPKLLVTLGVSRLIKKISKRPRPGKTLSDFSSLLRDPDPYSFPSAHSACAWAVAVGLGLALGGWPVWIAYAAAISYSRVHVGAHYPLDVVLGGALGAVIACLV